MPDLKFEVVTAEPEPFAVGPLLRFKLRVSQSAGCLSAKWFRSTLSRSSASFASSRPSARYAPAEQEKLLDLFGTPARWGQTLSVRMLWTHASVAVGPFTDSILVDLPVPCTYDFNVAVTKYFYALEDGEIPGHPSVQRHDVS